MRITIRIPFSKFLLIYTINFFTDLRITLHFVILNILLLLLLHIIIIKLRLVL